MGGLHITEPMTMLTDYLLAALCVALGLRLLRRGAGRSDLARRLWGGFFLAAALAALAGGTAHGFALHLGERGGAAVWKLTVLATGCASLLLLAAAVRAAVPGRWQRPALAAAAFKFVLYAVWMAGHDDFLYVILDYGSAALVVLALQAAAWRRERAPAAPWIAAGILVAFAAAAVQQSGFSLHRHFNQNDLYHLIQAGSFVLLYRGGTMLRDAGGPAGTLSRPVRTERRAGIGAVE